MGSALGSRLGARRRARREHPGAGRARVVPGRDARGVDVDVAVGLTGLVLRLAAAEQHLRAGGPRLALGALLALGTGRSRLSLGAGEVLGRRLLDVAREHPLPVAEDVDVGGGDVDVDVSLVTLALGRGSLAGAHGGTGREHILDDLLDLSR